MGIGKEFGKSVVWGAGGTLGHWLMAGGAKALSRTLGASIVVALIRATAVAGGIENGTYEDDGSSFGGNVAYYTFIGNPRDVFVYGWEFCKFLLADADVPSDTQFAFSIDPNTKQLTFLGVDSDDLPTDLVKGNPVFTVSAGVLRREISFLEGPERDQLTQDYV